MRLPIQRMTKHHITMTTEIFFESIVIILVIFVMFFIFSIIRIAKITENREEQINSNLKKDENKHSEGKSQS